MPASSVLLQMKPVPVFRPAISADQGEIDLGLLELREGKRFTKSKREPPLRFDEFGILRFIFIRHSGMQHRWRVRIFTLVVRSELDCFLYDPQGLSRFIADFHKYIRGMTRTRAAHFKGRYPHVNPVAQHYEFPVRRTFAPSLPVPLDLGFFPFQRCRQRFKTKRSEFHNVETADHAKGNESENDSANKSASKTLLAHHPAPDISRPNHHISAANIPASRPFHNTSKPTSLATESINFILYTANTVLY